MSINYEILPEHLRGGAERYIENGVRPGSFLSAVIRNDMTEAFGYADQINREYLHDIVHFFYCEAPSDSWGSREEMDKWIARGGLTQETSNADKT